MKAWFQTCAFCTPLPDLVQHVDRRHHPDCIWKALLKAAHRCGRIAVVLVRGTEP